MVYQGDSRSLYKYLFVCTGNTCRSPIAECLAREWLRVNLPAHMDRFQILSAGISTSDGFSASSGSIRVCGEAGLSIANHRTRRFTEQLSHGALVVAMTAAQRQIIARIAPAANVTTLSIWADGSSVDICDPCLGSDAAYINCFNQIKRFIDKGFSRTISIVGE